jgi:hypothetical protein
VLLYKCWTLAVLNTFGKRERKAEELSELFEVEQIIA